MLNAGYKVNVIPGDAEAHIDGRFLPGYEDEFFATIDELLGDKVRRETVVEDIALETEFSGGLVEAMKACLAAEDPQSRTAPLLMSGGTDAKSWSRLGVRCFGFVPLQLPPDLDFMGMFHGIDERVPTSVAGVRLPRPGPLPRSGLTPRTTVGWVEQAGVQEVGGVLDVLEVEAAAVAAR